MVKILSNSITSYGKWILLIILIFCPMISATQETELSEIPQTESWKDSWTGLTADIEQEISRSINLAVKEATLGLEQETWRLTLERDGLREDQANHIINIDRLDTENADLTKKSAFWKGAAIISWGALTGFLVYYLLEVFAPS